MGQQSCSSVSVATASGLENVSAFAFVNSLLLGKFVNPVEMPRSQSNSNYACTRSMMTYGVGDKTAGTCTLETITCQ